MKVSLEMLVSDLTPEQAKWFAARVQRDATDGAHLSEIAHKALGGGK